MFTAEEKKARAEARKATREAANTAATIEMVQINYVGKSDKFGNPLGDNGKVFDLVSFAGGAIVLGFPVDREFDCSTVRKSTETALHQLSETIRR